MTLHPALPQTKTQNELGAWIADNSIEPRTHEEKVNYTEKEIAEWKSRSALISIEIDKLEGVKETFMSFLKKGTPFDQVKEIFEDQRVIIPGTKGIDKLKENREHAGLQITNGFHIVSTSLFGIPFPEGKKICFFDLEANHWEQYDYKMNPHQLTQYGGLFEDRSSSPALTEIEISGPGIESVKMSGKQFMEKTDRTTKKAQTSRKAGEDHEQDDDLPFDVV